MSQQSHLDILELHLSPYFDTRTLSTQGVRSTAAGSAALQLETPYATVFDPASAPGSPAQLQPPIARRMPEAESEATEFEFEDEGEGFDDGAEPEVEHQAPSDVSKNVAEAVRKNDWPLGLKIAIQEGWRDVSKLTNLIFFAKHRDLERRALDPKDPRAQKLIQEWIGLRDREVWSAIQEASANIKLVVSGKDVTQWDREFWGKSGQEFKRLVEGISKEVEINPGLLSATLLAETGTKHDYLTKATVSSYRMGVDDFYERRHVLSKKVPAYAKVGWNKDQKPDMHLNDARVPRGVKTIRFDSGPDALLASAVYLKYGEIVLREEATALGREFGSLPVETRFALIRIAFTAGPGGAKRRLARVLKGEDILVRKDIPLRPRQTERNATIRTAQAMHLSEWIFGVPMSQKVQREAGASEAFEEGVERDEALGTKSQKGERMASGDIALTQIGTAFVAAPESALAHSSTSTPRSELLAPPRVPQPDFEGRENEGETLEEDELELEEDGEMVRSLLADSELEEIETFAREEQGFDETRMEYEEAVLEDDRESSAEAESSEPDSDEFVSSSAPKCYEVVSSKKGLPQIGFEFDMNYGASTVCPPVNPDTGDLGASVYVLEGKSLTTHRIKKEGFRVEGDGNRMELATKAFDLSASGRDEMNRVMRSAFTFVADLQKQCARTPSDKSVGYPANIGAPRDFKYAKLEAEIIITRWTSAAG